MSRQLLIASFGWGFLLWLFGFALGMLFFTFLPTNLLGWVIMPIGTAVTLWVLTKKISLTYFKDYLLVAIVWTLIAVVGDYLFIVKAFNPVDGYYKLDVYLYYILAFSLPIIIGLTKTQKK